MLGSGEGRLGADRVFAAIEPVMAAQSFETAVIEAARRLSELAGPTVPLGLVIMLKDEIFLESWFPEETGVRSALRTHLRRFAIESARRGEGAVASFPANVGNPLEPRVLLLPLGERLTGVLCFARSPAVSGDCDDALLTQAASLMGQRLATIQDIEAERRRSGQYERWFQASVLQIRTLDCERQKFAALANTIDASVFVADRTGIVRWCSRSVVERSSGSSSNDSFVAHPCQELCRQIGGGHLLACGRCLVARVVEREPGSQPIVSTADVGGHMVRITARPIRNAKGRAEEVIVVLQDLLSANEQRVA